ncbi:MAG: hypothetical protein LV480_01750 [Methylacidiphilales bacterium]|nr:hypothetical protein [Candidatus Methylacidiphilales bacterium]
MKEKAIVGGIVGLIALVIVVATRCTDAIFVAVSIAFFVLCIVYAEGCDRL